MRQVDSEPVAEWYTRHPLGLAVLHQCGVDPIDPGRSLAACCRDAHLGVDAVVAEVAAREDAIVEPWRSQWPADLIEHIVAAYHRPFAGEIGALEDAIGAAAAAAAAPAAGWRGLAARVGELAADMAQHMDKEERVLFPWLRVRARTVAAPIRAMQLEHADTLAAIRAVVADAARCPRDAAVARALTALVGRLCEHIHLEGNELFPRALDAAQPS
jgi:regulator of cell morphogenesis and NO signaling